MCRRSLDLCEAGEYAGTEGKVEAVDALRDDVGVRQDSRLYKPPREVKRCNVASHSWSLALKFTSLGVNEKASLVGHGDKAYVIH